MLPAPCVFYCFQLAPKILMYVRRTSSFPLLLCRVTLTGLAHPQRYFLYTVYRYRARLHLYTMYRVPMHHAPCTVNCVKLVRCTVHRVLLPCAAYRIPLPCTVYHVPSTVNRVPCTAHTYHVPCTVCIASQPNGVQGNRRLGVPAKLPSRGLVAPDPGTDPGKSERHTRGNPCGVPVRGGAAKRQHLPGRVGETAAAHISKNSMNVPIVRRMKPKHVTSFLRPAATNVASCR